jgi:hypothetical protein
MKWHQCRDPAAFRRFLNCVVELKTVVSLAQHLDVLDIRRDFGWQRGLHVGGYGFVYTNTAERVSIQCWYWVNGAEASMASQQNAKL